MRLATFALFALFAWAPAHAADLALKPKPGLPNPVLTPGESNPVLTKEKICGPGFRTGPFGTCRKRSSVRSIALTACRYEPAAKHAPGAVRSIISGLSSLGERIRARISGRSPTAGDGTPSKRTPSKIVCTSWSVRAR